MVAAVLENQDFLTNLAHATRYSRNRMIALASANQIRAIQEIALNLVNRNITVKKKDFLQITKGRHKKYITAAASKGSVESKRKLFIQRSGMLQYIIPAALNFLAEYR